MGKLHEIIAVEPDLKAAAQRATSGVTSRFKAGRSQFLGLIKVYRPIIEDGEMYPDDEQHVDSSVMDELDLFAGPFSRWIDAAVQKEVSNMNTAASVILPSGQDGGLNYVLFDDLPAMALLNLEGKLVSIRSVFSDIPTNDPARSWDWNAQEGRWESGPTITFKTEKSITPVVGYDATPEHPADVKYVNRDVRIGEWSGLTISKAITVSEKLVMLERIDQLIIAVKKARQRANDVEALNVQVADRLFHYIFHGEIVE